MRKSVRLYLLAALALLVILPSMSINAAGDQYRRWLDDGKVFTCTDLGGGSIEVKLSNQNVEFSNLPVDAEFTINYIRNGVNTVDGPYTVEQTTGTRNYSAFLDFFTSYPLTFEFRLDTLIGGIVVYQSTVSVSCTADATVPVTPVNVIPADGTVAGCTVPLPSGSVQGRVSETTTALYAPQPDATTNFVLPAGSSWWVISAQDGYYQLWIACQANSVWVPASALSANYDPTWGGAPLPEAGG